MFNRDTIRDIIADNIGGDHHYVIDEVKARARESIAGTAADKIMEFFDEEFSWVCPHNLIWTHCMTADEASEHATKQQRLVGRWETYDEH